MAALETIRTKFGIGASIIIALGLLLFLVNPADIIQTVESASSKYDVGTIDGKRITYTDFEQQYKYFSDVREIMTGSSASSEQAQRQTREMTWQNLVQENLVIPTIRKAGINVGHQEEIDMFIGDNPSPVVVNSGLFLDQNGNFSSQAVGEFMNQAADDETGRVVMIRDYLQNAVRNNRYTEKYATLFSAASLVNSLQAKKAVAENNTTAKVSYVVAPNTYYPKDSTVVVSDADIKKYYANHKEDYRRQATRDIEYAVFEVKPSSSDIAAQNAEFVETYEEFANTASVRAFLQHNSDRQWQDRWYVGGGDLRSVNAEVDKFVAENKDGVSPVYKSGNTFFAVRIMETAQVPDSVYVRHIMLRGADARKTAEEVLAKLNRNNFYELAAEYSVDTNSKDNDQLGNLGWFTQNYLIPGFEPVLTAQKNKPFILNTQYGTHIVEVTAATKPVLKKKVAIYEKATLPSKETYSQIYNQANILAVRASGKYSSYKAACDSTGIYSRAITVNEGTDSYGSISHAKEVTRWAFDNKPGKASGIITVDNNYFFVVAVKEAHKEGIAPLEDVSEQISNQLYREKYAQKRAADVAAQIEGLQTLEEIAEKLGASVETLEGVSFSTSSAGSTEPAFIGAVASAKEGVISAPVAGIMGTYIVKVEGRETGSYYTEEDARNEQSRLDQYNEQMLLSVMTEKNVKDNRARFY